MPLKTAVTVLWLQAYKEHLEGYRHKKKESSMKTSASASSGTVTTTSSAVVVSHASAPSHAGSAVQLHCQLCDVACVGADTYAAHIRGIKHQKVCVLLLLLLLSNLLKIVAFVLAFRRLRSSSYRTLAVPRTCTTLGNRSFAVAGLRVWNSLPATIRQITECLQCFDAVGWAAGRASGL